MNWRYCVILISTMLLVQPVAADAFSLKERENLDFRRISLATDDEQTVDPVRLDQLERHLQGPKHALPNLRCLPLRGLNKVRLSISMTKGDGDTELDSTGYRAYIISGKGKSGYPDFLSDVRARLRKLKVSDELSLEEYKSKLPEVCIYATLASKTAPEFSSVALLVKQQVTPVGNPAQVYRIVTFQVERFGKDAPDGGKNPKSILKLVLDRFEYYWRLANEPDFGRTPEQ